MHKKYYYIKILLLTLGCIYANVAFTARVDTVVIAASNMVVQHKAIVIVPTTTTAPVPAVYLLHGYSGNYRNWFDKVAQLQYWADMFQMLIVCPDGNYSSWYLNSPIDTTSKYEDYIVKDVVTYIDKHYLTVNEKQARAITGLSMGGHGAFYIGSKFPQLFGAYGSMSGGLNLLPFSNSFDIIKLLGRDTTQQGYYQQYSFLQRAATYHFDTTQAIIFDCGSSDFFFQHNEAVHQLLTQRKIAHTYTAQPGKHNWDYWNKAVAQQLLFFFQYFKSNRHHK
ncbi:MAG TPA: XynC protein [Chitinophagaceae bacterium]|nr:XynC protein [Chitinophagaceae bacterium]